MLSRRSGRHSIRTAGRLARSAITEPTSEKSFALCVENKGRDDREKGRIYVIGLDEEAPKEGDLGVIDESRHIPAFWF